MSMFINVLVSVLLSVIAAKIAVRKEVDIIKETKLRDRYWYYLKALVSSKRKVTLLERQTYNICLFAKNDEVAEKARELLNQENLEDKDIEEMIKLMRKDLRL
ncbi:MAG: hypothetical protein IKW39_03900 [Alphaproteobacteria bacterium]|nr:hypothetical protein [Alphaproteobacteria bacterium]